MRESARDDTPYAQDPFGPSANPQARFASAALETARRSLVEKLDAGRVVAVVGPPGHGKTLLLHLVGEHEATRSRVAYLPFPSLDADELCTVVLESLGGEVQGPPREALLQLVAEHGARGGLTLLVDDAHALPPATATALAGIYGRAEGRLRLVFAALDEDAAYQNFQAFGPALDTVSLDGSLTEAETRRYIETRLAYGGARPELVGAFDADTVAKLHRASRGVPRVLNQAAQEVVRRSEPGRLPRLGELPSAPSDEQEERQVSLSALAERVLLGDDDAAGRAIREAEATAPISQPPAPGSYRMAREGSASRRAGPSPAPARPRAKRAAVARAPAIRRDEEPVPGFERLGGDPSSWGRRTLAGVVRWMALGAGVGLAVMWVAGQEQGAPDAAPIASPEPRSITPAAEVMRQGLPTLEPEPTPELVLREPELPELAVPPEFVIPAIDLEENLAEILAPPGPPGAALALDPELAAEPAPAVEPELALVPEPAVEPEPALVPEAAAESEPALVPEAAAESEPALVPEAAAEPQQTAAVPLAVEAPEAPESGPAAAEPALPPAPGADAISVSVNATPWASIEIDGVALGETPLARVQLAPGPRVFRVTFPDGTVREETVEISLRRRTISFEQ